MEAAWPADLVAYKRTPEFTEHTVPAALLRDHRTKPGVWARILVLEGKLHYQVDSLGITETLTPDQPGKVWPEIPHHVRPLGQVRFLVEFLRRAGAEPANGSEHAPA
ncbi:MAG: hypothetical protein RL434_661 [Pseudomonadota bacterium]|jgi:tellurite resistance-related uncharacterized protein